MATPRPIHDLKTWPEFFKAVALGDKGYEIRKADRDFQVGDYVRLQEYDPASKLYTGAHIMAMITYITAGGAWGIPSGLCVFSIRTIKVITV